MTAPIAALLQPMKDRLTKLRTSPADQAKLIAAVEAIASMHSPDEGWPSWCKCGDKFPCRETLALTSALESAA